MSYCHPLLEHVPIFATLKQEKRLNPAFEAIETRQKQDMEQNLALGLGLYRLKVELEHIDSPETAMNQRQIALRARQEFALLGFTCTNYIKLHYNNEDRAVENLILLRNRLEEILDELKLITFILHSFI